MKFTFSINLIFSGFVMWASLYSPVEAKTQAEIQRIIIEEAQNSRVPAALALAVAKVESNFKEDALSSAGARGVMQIMPDTGLNVFGVSKHELWNARLNIQLGIDYLEQLYDQYGERWDLALSHYNGGSLGGGTGASAQPHAYTRKYVRDVLRWKDRYHKEAKIWQVADNAPAKVKDGWTPAKTRVRKVPFDDALTVLNDERPALKILNDYYAQKTTTSNGRARQDPKFSTLDSDLEKSHFYARLLRARRTLDDFAPIVPWRNSANKS